MKHFQDALAAVQEDGRALAHVPEGLKTPELCRAADVEWPQVVQRGQGGRLSVLAGKC
jgi:hypothetical protein